MESESESRRLGVRCCGAGAAFLLLGLVAYFGGQSVRAYSARVAQWPSVTGKIVRSEVSTATVRTGRVVTSSPIADIQYAYAVNGKDYQGVQLRPLPMLHMKPDGTPAELVDRYPVGRSVQVYYDPGRPSFAVLNPELGDDAHKLIKSLALVGPCLALMGLLLAGIGAMSWVAKPGSGPAAVPTMAPIQQAPAATPRAVIAAKGPPPVKLGIVQRLIRGSATALGLFVLLAASVLLVAAARTPNPSGDESTRIVAMFIFGGAALLGAGLIYAGVRRPRLKSFATAA